MRSTLKTQGETEALRCTDATLMRYLESEVTVKGTEIRGVRVAAAAKNLLASLKWRHSQQLDVVPPLRTTHCCEGCETNAYNHCFFSLGVDKRGWEVMYACPGRSAVKVRDLSARLAVAMHVGPPSHTCIAMAAGLRPADWCAHSRAAQEPTTLTRHLVLSLESVFEGPFEEIANTPASALSATGTAPLAALPSPRCSPCQPRRGADGRPLQVVHASSVELVDDRESASGSAAAPSESAARLPAWCRPSTAKQMVMLVDLHGFGLGDMDPRVGLKSIPILLSHYPDRVAQVALLDSPWVFKGIWAMLTPLLDPVMEMKVRLLRGDDMHTYFQRFLTPEQTEFMVEILKLKAAPRAESFPPITPLIRRSLGPCDKYMRDHMGNA